MRGVGRRWCAALALTWPIWCQGVWERRAPYPIEATEVSAAVIDGKVFAVCGLIRSGRTNALFIYDPATDAWREGARLPVAVGADHCNVAAVGGKLYVLGGLSDLANGDTYEYDPGADRWQLVGRMPTPRGASGVAAIDNWIYVAGGLAGAGSVNTFEAFDTATRQWLQLPPMPTARDHLTAQAVNGKFYALAGRVGQVLAANEEYDPATNSWRRRAPILTPRGGLASGTIGGRIQVFGGEGPSGTPTGTYPQNEEYDPAADTWRSLTPMPTPRHGLYGATVSVPGSAGVIFTPSGGPIQGGNYSTAHEVFYLADQPPAFERAGVVNGASLTREVGPGTIVSLFGRRLAPLPQAVLQFPIPTQMHTVQVKVNGTPLPLFYVGPEQINFHLPYVLPEGPLNLTVTYAGVESAPVSLSPAGTSWPGIFTLTQNGQGQGAILIAGTAQLAGQVAGVPSRPARRDDVIEIYCTGLGRLSATPPAPGEPAPLSPLLRTAEPAAVTIGGSSAEVLFSGLAPGLVGVYQVNARIPSGVAAGPRVPVLIRMADTGPASNAATIAIAEN